MHDAADTVTPIDPSRKLADAIRDVKNALADRDDVVVDLREAHRMRLDLLASELAPVFADVPANASATIVLPDGATPFDVGSGSHEWTVTVRGGGTR